MTHLEKLQAIRQQMEDLAIDAYIIPSADPHISEYLPKHFNCISWTSGFTGSAGTLVITQDFAGLWTDSRYFVQAKEQLEGSGFELVKLQVQHNPEYIDWIKSSFPNGGIVASDGYITALLLAETIENKLSKFNFTYKGDIDLLDSIWEDRPALPKNLAYLLPTNITGQSAADKINTVKESIKEQQANAHLISSLDDLAWILNMRGTDVPCNPVFLGFLLIHNDENILFIGEEKLNPAQIDELKSNNISVKPYNDVNSYLNQLNENDTIWIDPKKTCFAIYNQIPKETKRIFNMNPSTLLKAVKNETEINHTKNAMVLDGLALTKFFKWLEESLGKKTLTELSIAAKLKEFRAEQPGFKDVSFTTIAGYKAHGALPHYSATIASDSTLEADGLLLIDSGGQYENGTTDITRVISLGNTTAKEREDYTIVLKGTIEGSAAIFTKGTRGYQIDAITRRPIWATKRNYGHGTGHGVGFFLNVHEGPQVFNGTNTDIALVPGMITSIEPGLYKEGEYGIRIENLVNIIPLETNQFGEFYEFETLTVCYIDTNLVDKSILENSHITWLNNYNEWVYNSLKNQLSEDEAQWLRQKTLAI